MILDSSALVAIALDDPGQEALVAKINAVGVGAPTLLEAGIVISSRTGRDAGQLLAELVAASDAVVIEFGPGHWREALSAWWRFGKSRPAASLNFGDCLAYAVARLAKEPLLAKGNGFAQTDIQLA
jgi:ribonuclease VapC